MVGRQLGIEEAHIKASDLPASVMMGQDCREHRFLLLKLKGAQKRDPCLEDSLNFGRAAVCRVWEATSNETCPGRKIWKNTISSGDDPLARCALYFIIYFYKNYLRTFGDQGMDMRRETGEQKDLRCKAFCDLLARGQITGPDSLTSTKYYVQLA